MKNVGIILLLLLSIGTLNAQDPVLDWARGLGGAAEDAGTSMAIDGSGNVYTIGYFHGTSDFDPGAGVYNLTSSGFSDIFILKLDPSGNFLWANKMGGSAFDNGLSLTLDASGNIYATGYFSGTVDFNPGGGGLMLTSAGSTYADFFIVKFSSSGNFIFAKNLGGNNNDYSFNIKVDQGGNIYTTGYFQGTSDFDPGPGSSTLTSVGIYDIFVSKLDASGNFAWAKQLGSGHPFYSSVFYNQCSVDFDPAGNVVVAGVFLGTGDFDPGPLTFNLTSSGGSDIFVTMLSSSGNFIWAKKLGGGSNDYCFCVAVDANGNICTSGTFTGSSDFDPGLSNFILSAAGNDEIFVSKLDASGNYVWAKQMGGNGADWGNSICFDAVGNVYTTGYFSASADFDPGAGVFNLNSSGGGDIFVSKLDVSGAFLFAVKMGGTATDIGASLAVDAAENIFVAGIYGGIADFDPGAGSYNIVSTGGNDVFVVKLNQHCIPSVMIAISSGPVCPGSPISFIATPRNGGSAPIYQWKINGINAGTNSAVFTASNLNNLDVISVDMTSNATCATVLGVFSNSITISISPSAIPSVSISSSPSGPICLGNPVNFTALPTNGGANPTYQWKINGVDVAGNSPTFSSSSFVNGDVVTVVMTSNAVCPSPAVVTSNGISVVVNPPLLPSINISAFPSGPICPGTPINFIATSINGGNNPSYQWKINGLNVGTNSSSFNYSGLANGDFVSVSLISNALCATPATVNSNAIMIVVNPQLSPSINISASPSGSVCPNTPVTFTAVSTNGGTSPNYQWKVNGVNTGTNNPIFTSSLLSNGDVVTVVLTSNAICVVPATATSNAISLSVKPPLTPSVAISAVPAGQVCAGVPVNFTATSTNAGTAPSYQWKVNGLNAGANAATFNSTTLNNNDVVSVVLTSNAVCATPLSVTSNLVTMTVNPAVVPSVNISSNPSGAVCPGTSITFTAAAVAAGSSPSYQWKLNGSNAGSNSPNFTRSSFSNGDIVNVVVTSNAVCAAPLTAASTSITIVVNSTVVPTVNISTSPIGPVCQGTSVTFTASPGGGGLTPSYQWKINGANAGTNSSIFTSSILNNGDVITVVLTSSVSCASPLTATSNAVTMVVNPPLTPSANITRSPGGAVCPGTMVTFNANINNGGTSPIYQWKINGVNTGINASSFSTNVLVNGDIVTVVVISSETCASPSTATSNPVLITVNPPLIPSVNITASPTGSICPSTQVNFSATSINGGSNPIYQWQINGVNSGSASPTFSTNSLNNGDLVTAILTSNANCVTPATASSNIIIMDVANSVTPAVNIASSATGAVCPGTSITFTANSTSGGTSPLYQWKVNGINAGTNAASFATSSFSNGDVVTVVLTSSIACASPTTATSNAISVSVNPTVIPGVSITSTASGFICPNTSVSFTATPVNGGANPVYQWKLNGINVGTNNPAYTNALLANGDLVSVTMTSDAVCPSPAFANSNTIAMQVRPPVTPNVNITSSLPGAICPGTLVNFSATAINGGTNPSYQWKVNGLNVGTNIASFSSASLANGDVVSVEMISNAACATPANATSNAIAVVVNPQLVPAINIIASPSTAICPGTSVSFTATSTNGGTTPSYQWKLNGTNVGANAPTFNSSSLANGDIVTAIVTSNAVCATPVSVSSNSISIMVNPQLTPAVAISTSPTGPVCEGATVSFNATATNGGTNPVYQWKVNGMNVGTNAAGFSSNSLMNGDLVSVDLISNAVCAVPSMTSSNVMSVTVLQKLAPVVNISSNINGPLCSGSTVDFNASVINGGSNPSYQWKINGKNSGFNSTGFAMNKFNDGDEINVIVTSNLTCATPATAVSNIVKLTIDYALCPTQFFMPTGFTPNNDGKNDLCKPIINGKVLNYTFTIFNRWGNKVFETRDVNKGWDGRMAGKENDSNVYVWVCSFEFQGQQMQVKKGTVALIR